VSDNRDTQGRAEALRKALRAQGDTPLDTPLVVDLLPFSTQQIILILSQEPSASDPESATESTEDTAGE
jgi:hypothetical protein